VSEHSLNLFQGHVKVKLELRVLFPQREREGRRKGGRGRGREEGELEGGRQGGRLNDIF
jgi:hypothetical protein